MEKLSKSELIDLLKTDICAFNQYREDTNCCDIDLSGADLSGADLRWVNLYRANLSGADLNGVSLWGASLYRADLSDTNLRNADLNSADLKGANLKGANLYLANLYHANLFGANLISADLSGADLRRADLRQAILNYAILFNDSLFGANLSSANLSGADLRGANLRWTILNDTKGLLSNEDLLDIHFVKAERNHWIVYKAFGNTSYPQPDHWELKPGSILVENKLNEDRKEDCGSGVNFATLKWVEGFYDNPGEIWKCEVNLTCNVIMPYGTNGKGRCRKLKLIERVK
jgi:uncharacterized protein YjbI with pentapeptide repeats